MREEPKVLTTNSTKNSDGQLDKNIKIKMTNYKIQYCYGQHYIAAAAGYKENMHLNFIWTHFENAHQSPVRITTLLPPTTL